jgi:hypothetical protein
MFREFEPEGIPAKMPSRRSSAVVGGISVLLGFVGLVAAVLGPNAESIPEPEPLERRFAFFLSGDPQYLAENVETPQRLDPYSEEANQRFIEILGKLPGTTIPEAQGGGRVSKEILGIVVAGDLIDSLDKSGGNYPAMQRFEWRRFLADYGLVGGDGRIGFPVYELHGNHDGPRGDTFIIEAIVERNRRRPGLVRTSPNGLHYSWDWGPLHFVNVGIFVGEGETGRDGHRYAPRASLEFLREDLAASVGASGRPVVISHHLHLSIGDLDWPDEDLEAYWNLVRSYNVIAVLNGHTHASPSRRLRWNGRRVEAGIEGIDNFDPDDAGAAKLHQGNPVGLAHGVLYAELIDRPGAADDEFVVRSYVTTDNWATANWDQVWAKKIRLDANAAAIPASPPPPATDAASERPTASPATDVQAETSSEASSSADG